MDFSLVALIKTAHNNFRDIFYKYQLERVESVHKMGFLSKDIHPGNFCMGKPNGQCQDMVYMIDFGSAQPYTICKDVKVKDRPPRVRR